MTELYPLTFVPRFKELVWGGARLASELGKACPPAKRIGESWELVDLPDDQSLVAEGALVGRSLQELMVSYPEALLGPVASAEGRFPLLVKYIDAARTLSVQVHPDKEAARKLGGRPKHEAWYILGVEAGAKLYVGLQPGTTQEMLQEAIANDTLESLLVEVEACVGDLVPVEPGMVHAIGAGILLAEVQQPSDTTFRLHDWGRVGLDGRARPLHIHEALESISFFPDPVKAEFDSRAASYDAGHFLIRIHDASHGEPLGLGEGQGPLVVVGLDGVGRVVDTQGRGVEMHRGQVALFPHCCRPALVEGDDLKAMFVTFPLPR
ncbi:MAG: class I mannose-6-phosphate isomerase [Deltaproteobacteria bacterium]|nr:class I mannose-6-phosphate isomerase [Deltaproteobacteria bacterium]